MKWLLIATAWLVALPLGALQDKPEQSSKPGLCARYFNVAKEIQTFPALVEGQKPQLCRIDPLINFESKDGAGFVDLPWKEYFAVVWTGVLRVPKEAQYTFYLKSDDGSKLSLDGKVLIDHDGTHKMTEGAKSVDLTAGDHDFKLEYFQNRDKAGCVLSWKSEGMDKQLVPASAFWHRHDKELDAR